MCQNQFEVKQEIQSLEHIEIEHNRLEDLKRRLAQENWKTESSIRNPGLIKRSQ